VYSGNRGFEPEFRLAAGRGHVLRPAYCLDVSVEVSSTCRLFIYQARLLDDRGLLVVVVPGNHSLFQQAARPQVSKPA
jgi:hypothetical protein